ncbi:EID1-like F-box protein 3 [Olea europaea subsp. europaea]|uniref:EID1-like F-box protein 3 n=1 Tax=Olea europaea subsp. europaea TaxID=158383 RepID=A0A8S0QIC8_OLEEU|nr:EID1-like F-box protein 3 [Olea europaea subsp. europaea]
MDFEYLVPKNARLRAHISQRSNLRYVKTVLEHFDDRQCTRVLIRDAINKKEKTITYTVHGFPISMQIWAFEAMPKNGERFAWRLGHQSPQLLSWTCTKQPQQRTYDVFFKNIKLHVSATFHPTEAELGQPYISTLLPFEDRTVPALDDVARDIIPSQLHPAPLASGNNVGNSRGVRIDFQWRRLQGR